MSDTAADLLARVKRLVDDSTDPSLADDLRDYLRSREFGLVFEHNRPEDMRLYGKPVQVGDHVQILPPRGREETDDNRENWIVSSMKDGNATLIREDDGRRITKDAVSLDDLVVIAAYQRPIYAGLRKTGEVVNGDESNPSQIVINGENYHVLEALTFAYAGKVDCIYIDPPYNTGAKDWKYNNDYVGGDDQYRHSKWLSMMERRIKLAKQLLNPADSVLIVTIDEKEYLRLGMLLEQTFPGSDVQMISSVINPSGVARGNQFARTDEYIFIVTLGAAHPKALPLSPEWKAGKSSTSNIPRWRPVRRQGAHDTRAERPNSFFPIYIRKNDGKIIACGDSLPANLNRDEIISDNPDVEVLFPMKEDGTEGCWQIGQKSLMDALEKGYVRVQRRNQYGWIPTYLAKGEVNKIKDGTFKITGRGGTNNEIELEGEKEAYYVPGTQWRIPSHSARENGSNLIKALLNRVFPFPKSLYAVEDTLRFFVSDKPNALILDFFAGSGTTEHAVMRLNHQDGGHRQCICVTNNEVSAEEEKKLRKEGLRRGDPEWEQLGIAEYVTKPRVTAAITGRTPGGEPIKGDYKFFDEFPMSEGFKENAVFFDLQYLNPYGIELGLEFKAVAPLLWMRAGSTGRMITEISDAGYDIADSYAILFDYAQCTDFVQQLEGRDEIRTVYVVTDDKNRYSSLCAAFPDLDVVQLYEAYLRSFKIASEGALA